MLIAFLVIWGIVVVADSPLFSTLVAQTAPAKSRGTALTIVNCIGSAITIVTIQFINLFSDKISVQYIYMLLAIGPAFGLIALFKEKKDSTKETSKYKAGVCCWTIPHGKGKIECGVRFRP